MRSKTLQVDILKHNAEKRQYDYWKKYRYDMPIPKIGEFIWDDKVKKGYIVDLVLYESTFKAIGIYVREVEKILSNR